MEKSSQKGKPIELNISNHLPAYAVDGNAIRVADNGNTDIIFFQIINQDENSLNVNSVASVRLNIEQLTQLGVSISEAVEKHQAKTKK